MSDSEATRAEKKIAALLLVEADVTLTPEQVRSLIRKHWATLAPLAHIVHEAPDYTKGGSTSAPLNQQQPIRGGY